MVNRIDTVMRHIQTYMFDRESEEEELVAHTQAFQQNAPLQSCAFIYLCIWMEAIFADDILCYILGHL